METFYENWTNKTNISYMNIDMNFPVDIIMSKQGRNNIISKKWTHERLQYWVLYILSTFYTKKNNHFRIM